MRLTDVIDAYVACRQSLGMRFDYATQLLRRYSRAMGDQPIQKESPEAVLAFLNGTGGLTATWALSTGC
jgi:integrase/recombinase XerD